MADLNVAEIDVEIVRKDIKNIHFGVYPPNGRVRVAVPENVDDEAVRIAVISKLSWIRKQITAFQNQQRQSKREYVPRESHYYLGKRYLLSIDESKGKPTVIVNKSKTLILKVRPGSSSEKREKILTEWYRDELKNIIPQMIKKWEAILDVRVTAWGVRKMKTKWGSCNPKTGRILINLELIKKPVHCIDYIILHEMTHLIEKRHNDRFRDLLTHHMSHWQTYRDELNQSPLGHDEWQA
jgi:predicted metal-dependent hydrolase